MQQEDRNKYSIWSLLFGEGKAKDRKLTVAEQDAIVRRWRIISFLIILLLLLWFGEPLITSGQGLSAQESMYNPIKIFFFGLRHKTLTTLIMVALAFFGSYIIAFYRRAKLDEPQIIIDEAGDKDIFNAVMTNDDDKELLYNYFTTWSEDKNCTQIRSSLANAIDVFKTPAVIDILSSDEIDIDALADGNTSIYVACSGRNDTYMPVLTLFVNTVFHRTMSIAEENGGSLDHMLFILLEEFYSLGRLDQLPKILSQSRSYNLSVMISTQTTTQLEKYNTDEDRGGGRSSIESACALQLCVGANEGVGSDDYGDTATYFAARGGYKLLVTEQVTEDRFKPVPENIQAPLQWDQKKRTTDTTEYAFPPDRIQALTPDEIFISPGPHKCRIQKKYQWSLHPLFGTYAIDRSTGEVMRFLTTEHTPMRKGGKDMSSMEYEVVAPNNRSRTESTAILAGDSRDEYDFLAP